MDRQTLKSLRAKWWWTLVSIFIVSGIIGLTIASEWANIRGSYFLPSDQLMTTQGQIIRSRTYTNTVRFDIYYNYEIIYTYAVQGSQLQSRQVTFSYTGTKDPQFASNYVQRYPVGTTVTVYYDVQDPSFAVLEPQTKADVTWLVVVTSFWIVLILGWLVTYPKDRYRVLR